MGRAGIRRRKPKRELDEAEDTGILDDLYDQAEWSSYGSHIPRLGDTRRDTIWWRRGWRWYGGLLRPWTWKSLFQREGAPGLRQPNWWTPILVGGLLVAVIGAVLWAVVWLVGTVL